MLRRSSLVLVLALGLLALPPATPVAHAQRVDPGRVDPDPAPGSGEDALFALAGPRARARRDEQGRVRLLWGARARPWTGDPARDALAFTERFADVLGIPQGADLRVERTDVWHGLTVVRLRRFALERPVVGAGVVVRFLGDGSLEMVLADPGPARTLGGELIAAARASEIARGAEAGFAVVRTTEPRAAAIVVDDAIVPIWSIDLHGAAPSQRGRALLDARDGRVLAIIPLAIHALGRVFETNPTTTMGVTTDVELSELEASDHLAGSHFRVASCGAVSGGGCTGAQLATADDEGNFLYDPDASAFDDAFAEVNAYHHLSRAAAYHRERNGFTWSCEGGSAMRVLVNYTETPMVPYDNAAFSPASGGECGFLLFGQGNEGDFAYDADVVYHEHGHAVTDQVASILGFLSDNLGVSYEPLAVNEGTSDYYAAAIQGDPNIAESISGLGGGGLGTPGSLRVIAGDLSCPGSLFGEGHFDGRIWAGVGWDVREAIGADAADALMFTTVASITEAPSLADMGDLLVATADAMVTMGSLSEDEASTVQTLVAARGLPGCERVVPLDDGTELQGWSGNEYLTGAVGRSVAPVHYRIDVPADATSLRFHVGKLTLPGAYTLHFREGSPVRVSIARTTADAAVPVSGGSVMLDASSDYPLPRCRTLYVALEATDLRTMGQSVYTIRATLERSGDSDAECPAPAPDAGVAADGGVASDGGSATIGGGGCGCRVGERRAAPGALAAMLALGAAIALRRRGR